MVGGLRCARVHGQARTLRYGGLPLMPTVSWVDVMVMSSCFAPTPGGKGM